VSLLRHFWSLQIRILKKWQALSVNKGEVVANNNDLKGAPLVAGKTYQL
jgi:hypothetical protein